jgi:uncharacterized protein
MSLIPEAQASKGQWACMTKCGACCFLGDYDLVVMQDMLKSADDVDKYLRMIGADGWCTHYDKQKRGCSIYSDRPSFCRVEMATFANLYGVQSEEEMNDFAIDCCLGHIGEMYPSQENDAESTEMDRFRRLIATGVDEENDGNP